MTANNQIPHAYALIDFVGGAPFFTAQDGSFDPINIVDNGVGDTSLFFLDDFQVDPDESYALGGIVAFVPGQISIEHISDTEIRIRTFDADGVGTPVDFPFYVQVNRRIEI